MKKTAKKDKRMLLFVVEGAILVLLVLVLFGYNFYVANFKETTLGFKDQTVNKVSFSDFKLVYKGKATNISVKMKNTEVKPKTIKKVVLTLLDEEGFQLSRIEVNFEQIIDGKTQYLELTKDKESNVEARVLDNLTETKKVEYSFE